MPKVDGFFKLINGTSSVLAAYLAIDKFQQGNYLASGIFATIAFLAAGEAITGYSSRFRVDLFSPQESYKPDKNS